MRTFPLILIGIIFLFACFKPQEKEAVQKKAAAPLLAGSIDLKPELRSTADPLAVLFVIARTEDGRIGAVKKILPPFQFPVNFELSSDDLMIPGMDLKGSIRPTARLDADGNANPAQAGDIVGHADPETVEIGGKSVKIELNELIK